MLKNIADSTLLMKAKDARNLIITLIVLAIGIKILTTLGSRYATQAGAAGFESLIKGFAGLGDLAMYGIILLAVLLVPYYFHKRSQERI